MTLPHPTLPFPEPEEEWRPIPGFPNYEASSLGRLKRTTDRTCGKTGTILRQADCGNGYLVVTPSVDGKKKQIGVHRLIALAFHPKPIGRDVVNHINSTPKDNRAANLEWVTPSENVRHSYKTGRNSRAGELNNRSKLTWDKVSRIRVLLRADMRLSYVRIGKMFDVSGGTIGRIERGEAWLKKRRK